MAIVRSPGSRGLERLPVNYSRGLRRETPPIKPCGRLRRLRFISCMHDGGDEVCVGSGRARVLIGTRAAESVAFAPASPALAVAPRRS
jgi:hypothetical protein